MVHLLSSQSPALIQPDEELVMIPSSPVHVDAVRVVDISRRVDQTHERAIVVDRDFHVVVGTFGGDVCI